MKSLKKFLGLALVFLGVIVFAATFSSFAFPINVFFGHAASERSMHDVEEALNDDKNSLLRNAQELAGNQRLKNAVSQKDLLTLTGIAVEESNARQLHGMVITDADGVVLSRAANPTKRGDYIFDLTPWGARVAAGFDLASFDRGVTSPLAMLGGTRIMEGDTMLGSVITGLSPNDDYVTQLRKDHLPSDTEVVIFSSAGDIIGSTFQDVETDTILQSLLSANTPLATRGHAAIPVDINNEIYTARTISLFDSGNEPIGGVAIFTPGQPATVAIVLSTLFTFIFFLASSLLIYCQPKKLPKERMNALLAGLALIVFGVVFLIYYQQARTSTVRVERSPYTIYNSTMQFSPEYNIVQQSYEQQIAITVTSGGEAINAVQAIVHYDPTAVRVVDILTESSLCNEDLFIEKSIDAEQGLVTISCLVPTPGFVGGVGTVATLQVQPLRPGNFLLAFDAASAVLANDGIGTNVLRKTTDGSYFVNGALDTDEADQPLAIFSPSHPNSVRWYSNTTLEFSWRHREGSHYQYALNTTPDYLPTTEPSVLTTNVTLEAPTDGIFFFHVLESLADGTQAIAHHQVLLDFTPPPEPAIGLSETEVHAGQIVRMYMTNVDEETSYQPGFYVRMNHGVFFPVQSPVFLPFVAAGDYDIEVRVFDKAGNVRDAHRTVHVTR